ncbi:hypothetical protein ACFQXA_00090 [Nocardiopsis composta]
MRITAVVHPKTNRRFDPHNYQPSVKAMIDGLVDAGLLPDDNSEVLTEVAFVAGRRTRPAGRSSCASRRPPDEPPHRRLRLLRRGRAAPRPRSHRLLLRPRLRGGHPRPLADGAAADGPPPGRPAP